MNLRVTPFLIPAFLAMACASDAGGPSWGRVKSGESSAPDTCGAADFAHLVGMERAALDDLDLPEGTRIIPLGQPVTMDHLPERLNIYLNAQGQVWRVRCG